MVKWIEKILVLAICLIAAANLFGAYTFYGDKHEYRHRRYQTPKLIIDTLRVDGGIVSIELAEEFTRQRPKMRPTDSLNIFCVASPMLSDTSDSVHSYRTYYDEITGLLYIKSSSNLDSGKVVVMSMIK